MILQNVNPHHFFCFCFVDLVFWYWKNGQQSWKNDEVFWKKFSKFWKLGNRSFPGEWLFDEFGIFLWNNLVGSMIYNWLSFLFKSIILQNVNPRNFFFFFFWGVDLGFRYWKNGQTSWKKYFGKIESASFFFFLDLGYRSCQIYWTNCQNLENLVKIVETLKNRLKSCHFWLRNELIWNLRRKQIISVPLCHMGQYGLDPGGFPN